MLNSAKKDTLELKVTLMMLKVSAACTILAFASSHVVAIMNVIALKKIFDKGKKGLY